MKGKLIAYTQKGLFSSFIKNTLNFFSRESNTVSSDTPISYLSEKDKTFNPMIGATLESPSMPTVSSQDSSLKPYWNFESATKISKIIMTMPKEIPIKNTRETELEEKKEKFIDLLSVFKNTDGSYDLDAIVQEVIDRGVSAPRDQTILWSGLGMKGPERAREYAEVFGGITLEMTRGGRWLDKLDLFGPDSPLSIREATEVWGRVSHAFAQGAKGKVMILKGDVRAASIFLTKELPQVHQNYEEITPYTNANDSKVTSTEYIPITGMKR